MITPDYVRAMTEYNGEMNRRLYAAASRLPDAERRAERGAFWGSIHGTFNHLLWADQIWMSRFDGWEKPAVPLKQSGTLLGDFEAMRVRRDETDARLSEWAGRLSPDWLDGEMTWFSGAIGREVTRARKLLVVHFFNHQTHHRGQAHAMLTAAGEATGDTDLMVIVRELP